MTLIFRTLLAATLLLFTAEVALAQGAEGGAQAPRPTQPQQQEGPQRPADPQTPASNTPPAEQVGDTPISTQDYAPPSQQPKPPEPNLDQVAADGQVNVAMGVGTGSPVAFADARVVELGGTLALTHASETTTFRIAPSVGYFVVDNIELTLFPEVTIVNIEDETDVTFGALLEPSYHLPLSERLLVFAGIGVGLRYAEDPGVDFALRPKLGLDMLIGRSGILKPAVFLDIGANDGLTQGGFEAGFTVML